MSETGWVRRSMDGKVLWYTARATKRACEETVSGSVTEVERVVVLRCAECGGVPEQGDLLVNMRKAGGPQAFCFLECEE